MSNLNNLVRNFSQGRVLLIGDLILDIFVYGEVSRISPEGPIPILSATREEKMLGGAGNVFANLRALGVETDFISVVGLDSAGRKVNDKIEDAGGNVSGIIVDDERPTILKTRYLSQGQQLLRVDHEKTDMLAQHQQEEILKRATDMIGKVQVLILSDYGKGVLAPYLIKDLIKLAKKHKVPVIVDPKQKDFSVYKGATIITPNKKELSEAAGHVPVKTDDDVEVAASHVIRTAGIETVIATRSGDGISVVSKRAEMLHLKTRAQEVYDVSGAGDTVVAVIAAALAGGGSEHDAAHLANIAGGLVVAKVGTAVIRSDEILAALAKKDGTQDRIAPVMEWDAAKEQVQKWQKQGLKVGFTNGCFDIVHYGHVNYLDRARDKCDRLVMGLNHDKSVKILKGPERPINDEKARASVIGAMSSVDLVVYFGAEKEGEDNTPVEVVSYLKPDIFMKGGDYTIDQLPEGKAVLSYGGEVEIMPLYEGYSTTNIIEKSKTEAA
jgi:D-beta-D-heptose 7-phosphate kinase/D-beta-D-heptose 1-phosphate adenosyltransferase